MANIRALIVSKLAEHFARPSIGYLDHARLCNYGAPAIILSSGTFTRFEDLMFRLALLFISTVLASISSFAAEAETQKIGDWIIKSDRDRFESRQTVLALLINGSSSLAVRCLANGLTIGLMDRNADSRFQRPGDTFDVKFRVDSQRILTFRGEAVTGDLIQLNDVEEAIQQVAKGSEIALRVTKNGRSSSFLFAARGAKKAMAYIADSCPTISESSGNKESANAGTPDWLKVAVGRVASTTGLSCNTTDAFDKFFDDKSDSDIEEKNKLYGCNYKFRLVKILSTEIQQKTSGSRAVISVETVDRKWKGFTILDNLKPIPPVGTELLVTYVSPNMPAYLYPTKDAEAKSGNTVAMGTRVRMTQFDGEGLVNHKVQVMSGEHRDKIGWLMDIELTLPQGAPLEFVR